MNERLGLPNGIHSWPTSESLTLTIKALIEGYKKLKPAASQGRWCKVFFLHGSIEDRRAGFII